jgi:hypothetical protein
MNHFDYFIKLHNYDFFIYGVEDYFRLTRSADEMIKIAESVRKENPGLVEKSGCMLEFNSTLCQPDQILGEVSHGFFDSWDRPPAVLLSYIKSLDRSVVLGFHLPTVAIRYCLNAAHSDAYGCIELIPGSPKEQRD